MSLQKKLDALQPYVIGIRYLEKMVVVDAVFKDDWIIPDSKTIQRAKGNESVNYQMIFSDVDGVGLDDLLDYVEQVIKLNRERELKHELLKVKVQEMKEIFKKNPLIKLHRLSFRFDDEIEPTIEDIDDTLTIEEPVIVPKPLEQPIIAEVSSDEELEMLEEERRAENFRKRQEAIKVTGKVKNVELPPKKVVNVPQTTIDVAPDCECNDNEACDKCIHTKDL